MKYLKIFEDFVEVGDEYELGPLCKDALSDILDNGFDVIFSNISFNLNIRILNPGMEYGRSSKLGFNINDIKDSVNELIAQLDDKMWIKSIYYHLKGYEASTWYSVDFTGVETPVRDIGIVNNLPTESIDDISIEFVPPREFAHRY